VGDTEDEAGVGEAADDAEAILVVEAANDVEPTDVVGASLTVALLVVGGVKIALLGNPVDLVEETSSDVGTLVDWLAEEVRTADADVPTDGALEGRMPELAEPEESTLEIAD
jgi:hypothetical protein